MRNLISILWRVYNLYANAPVFPIFKAFPFFIGTSQSYGRNFFRPPERSWRVLAVAMGNPLFSLSIEYSRDLL